MKVAETTIKVRDIAKKSLKRRMARLLDSVSKSPIAISVDLSGSCNFNCRMCSLKKWYPKDSNRVIPDEIVEKIANIVPRLRTIYLQCNCEPLLNPNITQIIRGFKDINPKLRISFVTNGSLLTPSLSSELIDAGLDEISFSIDGASAKVHNSTRRGSRLDKLVRNIKELNIEKESAQSEIPKVGISTVSSTDNIHELVSILQLACELRASSFSINGLEPYDEEMEELTLWGETINPEFSGVFPRLRKLARANGIEIRLPSPSLQFKKSCFNLGCVIDSNGEVYPCSPLSYERPYFYLGEKRLHSRMSFGSLRDTDFLEIWNSEDYRNFRKRVQNGHLPDCCRKCLLNSGVICP